MPVKTFEIEKSDLKKLKRFYKDLPRISKNANKNTVNNLAFKLRGYILEELDRGMTIRSPRFVKGSVRLTKAKGLQNPTAEVGSIERERFSGWAEQETGKITARHRVQTKAARGRNWTKRVAPRFRLKRANRLIKPADVGLKERQIVPFLQILSRRKNFRQPFLIPLNRGRLLRGSYIFLRKKLTRIQNFNPGRVQPERDRWMSRSVKRLSGDVAEEYRRALKFSVMQNARKRGL